ncbi:hypothetical protein JCGZ_23664 [Jatropha curcas]|uniref:Uncharacterized protein n=1 Tax=Jatropha curcas TaxID=180498 RepID=A0A067LF81_JATCU|nr:GDSL esterase/lipase At5g03610 [Jatropha curcas]KDP42724.1 hypothetical protein JCGZ_23664 [Jatropha curcas]
MATVQTLLFSSSLLLLLLSVIGGVHGGLDCFSPKPRKLFVFGDSYVDTGNNMKALASSWQEPYGITYPGKPTGRYSNGRVFTDFLARFLGIRSPIPFKFRKYAMDRLIFGANFAYGGTGVFDTVFPEPNMTTQIDFFQQLINEKIYSQRDLNNSLAILSLAGNDYSTYLIDHGGNTDGIMDFINKVVDQLALNMKRIYELGVRRVAVNELAPLGCLPQSTMDGSFKECDETRNGLVSYHNMVLETLVAKLNNETNAKLNQTANRDAFVTLDLYVAFKNVLNGEQPAGTTKFATPLIPCCKGTNSTYSCGDVVDGKKMYTICDNPDAAFFWDYVHPTQEGWRTLYMAMQSDLHKL